MARGYRTCDRIARIQNRQAPSTRRSACAGGAYQRAASADQIVNNHRSLATHLPSQQFPGDDATAAIFLHTRTAHIALQPSNRGRTSNVRSGSGTAVPTSGPTRLPRRRSRDVADASEPGQLMVRGVRLRRGRAPRPVNPDRPRRPGTGCSTMLSRENRIRRRCWFEAGFTRWRSGRGAFNRGPRRSGQRDDSIAQSAGDSFFIGPSDPLRA